MYQEPAQPTKSESIVMTLFAAAFAIYGIVSMVTGDMVMGTNAGRWPRANRIVRQLAETPPPRHIVGWEAELMGLSYVFLGLMIYFWFGGLGWERYVEHRQKLVVGCLLGVVACVLLSEVLK